LYIVRYWSYSQYAPSIEFIGIPALASQLARQPVSKVFLVVLDPSYTPYYALYTLLQIPRRA
jgi:hypothetical protein